METQASSIFSQLSQVLNKHPEIHLAIVFGSFARGKERPESDLDLALAGKDPFSFEYKVDLANEISVEVKREVDLIDLNAATGTVAKEALRNGKLLLLKDPKLLAKILSRLIYEEEDFQKMRARLMAVRRKKAFDVA